MARWWKVGVPSVSYVSSVGGLRCLVGRSSLGLSPDCSSVGVPLPGSVGTGISGLPVDVSWRNSGLVTGSAARVLLEGVVSGSTGIKVSSPSGSSSELSSGIELRGDVVGGRVVFGFHLELPRGVFSGFTSKGKSLHGNSRLRYITRRSPSPDSGSTSYTRLPSPFRLTTR